MSRPTVRALALLEMLQSSGPSSGSSLAAELKIDRRTLRRYIATLEEIGIPVMTSHGRFGGYRLVPGFRLPPMMFTDDEALALAIGLLAARNLGAAQPLGAARTAQSKLERVLPSRLKIRLSAVNESITLQFGRPTANLNQGVLMRMTGAAQDQRRVSLRYQTQQGVHTQRNFDPYGLVYQHSRWYAVGMCHLRRGLRSFRLDRIAAASILDARFERPAGFDALDYLRQSIAELPRSHSIEVLLHTDLATAQRDLFSAFGLLEWTGDAVLLRSQAYDLNWFARELARLPFDLIVRSPAALRDALAAHGRRLTRLARQRKTGK